MIHGRHVVRVLWAMRRDGLRLTITGGWLAGTHGDARLGFQRGDQSP